MTVQYPHATAPASRHRIAQPSAQACHRIGQGKTCAPTQRNCNPQGWQRAVPHSLTPCRRPVASHSSTIHAVKKKICDPWRTRIAHALQRFSRSRRYHVRAKEGACVVPPELRLTRFFLSHPERWLECQRPLAGGCLVHFHLHCCHAARGACLHLESEMTCHSCRHADARANHHVHDDDHRTACCRRAVGRACHRTYPVGDRRRSVGGHRNGGHRIADDLCHRNAAAHHIAGHRDIDPRRNDDHGHDHDHDLDTGSSHFAVPVHAALGPEYGIVRRRRSRCRCPSSWLHRSWERHRMALSPHRPSVAALSHAVHCPAWRDYPRSSPWAELAELQELSLAGSYPQ
mmetsp:Transcript_46235/g.76452  ORF Transcript_46235/g.76452 Transcript_46235/m.76452 type:complete len:344 (+) Transcript_46235:176-1207(+)